jgi:hypothetical protein
MNDPRHPPQAHGPQPVRPAGLPNLHGSHPHRVANPQHGAGPGPIDPLVESSHAQSHHAPGAHHAPAPKSDDPIELIDEEPEAMPVPAANGIRPIGAHAEPARKIVAFGGGEKQFTEQWKRKPTNTGTGACRVKSFHGKYSDEGLRYLDNAVNQWLDDHPDIEVKFVTPTVMTFEGKTREPALVLNVWY